MYQEYFNPAEGDVLQAIKAQLERHVYSPPVVYIAAKYNRIPRKLKKKLSMKQRNRLLMLPLYKV
jgi:hypothetical protein